MAEFDPVGWLHEQGFQLDIHTAKMVNALAAEARRRAMEEISDDLHKHGHALAAARVEAAIERAKGEG